ncbi:hypothetical protein ACFO1B_01865 [Dactylosporangium siamense]|uniref:Uncharacterized protein n=1 Tax=Dactylosporangium siamense TaxID=685454 RepID=A0A919PQJ7_9ACTN|nr:hypothetical protein [Dactylosporangium siamense]GIG48412.1 hypothetical protein Dsi01nite_064530 [Dactylosporangium siamense]
MDGQLVTAITSLGGVVLGGGLSYLVQHHAQRMSAHAEQRRQDDARRAERLVHLERFVTVAAEAERVAIDRPDSWSAGEPWHTTARETMRRFWVAQHMLRVLFPNSVNAVARAYFRRLNRAVWDGVPSLDDLYTELDDLRDAFLAAARTTLD